MILQRFYSKRTDYSSLDPMAGNIARWRRGHDKRLRNDIKQIDRETAGLEAATKPVNMIGSASKSQLRNMRKTIRQSGNTQKLKRIFK